MNELYRFRYLICELVLRDIKIKYRRSLLGVLWSILNPLMMMVIMIMVFSNLFRFQIPNYPLYVLTGQIILTFYSESTNFAMGSILGNAALIKKVYVPKMLFPLSRVLSSLVNLVLMIPALLVAMWYTDHPIMLMHLWAIVPLLMLFFFCFGFGLLLSTMSVYFRDMFHLYGVVLMALSYATPAFYPISIVPPQYMYILVYNPLFYYMETFRTIIYSCQYPDSNLILICSLLSIFTFAIGMYVFKKWQNNFILYI